MNSKHKKHENYHKSHFNQILKMNDKYKKYQFPEKTHVMQRGIKNKNNGSFFIEKDASDRWNNIFLAL